MSNKLQINAGGLAVEADGRKEGIKTIWKRPGAADVELWFGARRGRSILGSLFRLMFWAGVLGGIGAFLYYRKRKPIFIPAGKNPEGVWGGPMRPEHADAVME